MGPLAYVSGVEALRSLESELRGRTTVAAPRLAVTGRLPRLA
jgi:hypothetical protein